MASHSNSSRSHIIYGTAYDIAGPLLNPQASGVTPKGPHFSLLYPMCFLRYFKANVHLILAK